MPEWGPRVDHLDTGVLAPVPPGVVAYMRQRNLDQRRPAGPSVNSYRYFSPSAVRIAASARGCISLKPCAFGCTPSGDRSGSSAPLSVANACQ